jgi:hypothetical protein
MPAAPVLRTVVVPTTTLLVTVRLTITRVVEPTRASATTRKLFAKLLFATFGLRQSSAVPSMKSPPTKAPLASYTSHHTS